MKLTGATLRNIWLRRTSRRALGVAFDERSAVVAEVRLARGDWQVERTGEFTFPEGLSWQDTTRLGKAFGQFLRQQRFAARRAVVGLPADWLMAREVNVPPADPKTTAGIVRLQAEREFSSDPAEIVLDYADAGDGRQERPVLVVATVRERLNQVAAMANAARLTLLSVTSSALAVSAASGCGTTAPGCEPSSAEAGPRPLGPGGGGATRCAITLLLWPGKADLVARTGSHFCALSHIPVPKPAPIPDTADAAAAPAVLTSALLGEVRRATAAACRHAPRGEIELALWDGIGLPADAVSELSARLGLAVKARSKLADIGVRPPRGGQDEGAVKFVPAAALGIAALNGQRPPINLLHSRLEPTARKVMGRRAVWAVVVTAAVFIAILALFIGWQRDQAEVTELSQRLAGMKKDMDSAQDLVDKVSFAGGWYDDRPKVLDCLRALTSAFPPDGKAYITSFSIKPPSGGQVLGGAAAGKAPAGKKGLFGALIGKSPEEKAVIETLDRLKRSRAFSDVTLGSMRAAGRAGRDISFSISFSFVATE